MKEYQVKIERTYTTYITLKFPDDGKDHTKLICSNLLEGEEHIWYLIAEKELEQMDVDNETWEIKKINNTITGALSPDTGPRN